MTRRRRERGYTLIEMVVSLAVFGIIVAIFAILTAEMRDRQKRMPMNLMRHPQVSGVISRIRRDVQDTFGPEPYMNQHDGYTMSEKTLIIRVRRPSGGLETVVWDFREKGVAHRRSYNVGVATDWFARGLPAEFSIDDVDIPGTRTYGVRVKATDSEGRLAIDQILQPRPH